MQNASAAEVLVKVMKAIWFVALLLLKAIWFVALLLLKIIGFVEVVVLKAIGLMPRAPRLENAEGGGDAEPRVLVREHTRAWPGSKSCERPTSPGRPPGPA